ncbi:hypothetical protein V8B97DRAFT_1108437 [Scleroderma yunnanense]
MRQLVHYDLDSSPGPSKLPQTSGPSQPAPKKRKHTHERGVHPSQIQHWDDPGNAQEIVVYDEQEIVPYENGNTQVEEEEGEEIEESRELTHEEIWDDSALIDAWNSAEAEYNAYHGKSKDWKKEAVKKSPLWYNVPCTVSTPQVPAQKGYQSKPSMNTSQTAVVEDENNTAPIDFDTFVPKHDPSLLAVSEPPPSGFEQYKGPGFFSLPASSSMVSRDEAFNNALSAMYWTGYWTAVYHCQSSKTDESIPDENRVNDVGKNEEDELIEGASDEEGLVPAQR